MPLETSKGVRNSDDGGGGGALAREINKQANGRGKFAKLQHMNMHRRYLHNESLINKYEGVLF
jgi:hypothetical protein